MWERGPQACHRVHLIEKGQRAKADVEAEKGFGEEKFGGDALENKYIQIQPL